MSENLNGLVRAIGAVTEGFDHETVMDALGSFAMMQIVNNTDSLSEALEAAQQLSDEISSMIPVAYEVLDAKELQP